MVIIVSKPYPGDWKIEVDLPVGSHNYSISAYGYIISQGSVALNEFAPRQITENLVKDPSTSNEKKTSKDRKKSKSEKKKINTFISSIQDMLLAFAFRKPSLVSLWKGLL
mgnify:CR=1 FL=1